jgi:hypothetical protein
VIFDKPFQYLRFLPSNDGTNCEKAGGVSILRQQRRPKGWLAERRSDMERPQIPVGLTGGGRDPISWHFLIKLPGAQALPTKVWRKANFNHFFAYFMPSYVHRPIRFGIAV